MYFKPQGWGCLSDPSLPSLWEHDSFTCSHCCRIVIVLPRCAPEDFGGRCKLCYKLVCPPCYGRAVSGHGCTIFEKRMEEAERRAKFNLSFEAALNGDF